MNLHIDLGRTWMRAWLADETGRVLRRTRLPAVPWRRLAQNLPKVRRRLKFARLELLRVGATGIWSATARAEAKRLWRGWAKRIEAISDVELAHAAIFGAGPGLLIVASTGSIALVRDGRARLRRAGGWGPLLGDEGSGFWIGKSALGDASLRRKLRLDPLALAHSSDPVRCVSLLAPKVLRLARRDARARRIRDEAARHLAGLAAQARQGADIPIACWGGLFQDKGLRKKFLQLLPKNSKIFPSCA